MNTAIPRTGSRSDRQLSLPQILVRILIGLIIAAVLLWLWQFMAARTHLRAQQHAIGYVDESGSMLETQGQPMSPQNTGFKFLEELLNGPLASTDLQIAVFSGPNPRDLYRGNPLDAEDLAGLESQIKRNMSAERGTRAVPALKQALQKAQELNRRHQSCGIYFITDGALDDIDQIAPLVKQFATISNVRVFVIGPVTFKKDFRTRIETALKPLGKRAVCFSAVDAKDGFNRVRDLLNP